MDKNVTEDFEILKKKLGQRIKDLRKKQKLRQEDFERGGDPVSVPTLQRIENGRANPSLLQLHRIAKHLNIDVRELF